MTSTSKSIAVIDEPAAPASGVVVEDSGPVEDPAAYAEQYRRLFGVDRLPGDPNTAALSHRDAFTRAAQLPTEAAALQAMHIAALTGDEACVMAVAWKAHNVAWGPVLAFWIELRPGVEADYRALLGLAEPVLPEARPALVGVSRGEGQERRIPVVPHPLAIRQVGAEQAAAGLAEALADPVTALQRRGQPAVTR